jgi:hypothetical protein
MEGMGEAGYIEYGVVLVEKALEIARCVPFILHAHRCQSPRRRRLMSW